MYFLVFIVLPVFVGAFDLESFRNSESVLFSTVDQSTKRAFLEFAPADPDDQDVDSDDFLDTETLVFTKEGFTGDYWGLTSSYTDGKIWCNEYRREDLLEYDISRNESSLKAVVRDLTEGLENLAYDRVTKILYWTDAYEKAIFAIEKTYRHFTTVFESQTTSPYALALHTTKRKIFFSVFTSSRNVYSNTEMVKCDLDGTNQETILRYPEVIRPNGLTIDFSQDRLFWTDRTLSGEYVVVFESNLDGKSKRQFFSKPEGYLWGIAHYKNYIYVVDTAKTTDNVYDIHIRGINGSRNTTLKTKLKPRNVDIFGPNEISKTKVTNECDENKCDQLCLASASGNFVCRCSPGYQLVSESRCQSSLLSDDYLVVADLGQKRLFQLPIRSSAVEVTDIVAIPTEDLTNEKIYAFDVGPKSGDLAWYDLDNDEIVWGDKKLPFSVEVVSIAFHCCEDKISFLTDKEILSWDGKSTKAQRPSNWVIFSNLKNRQLAVDCIKDHIYRIQYDTNTKTSILKRSDYEGREEIVLRDLPVSEGMTIDYETYTLHIVTRYEGILYSIPLKKMRNIPSTDPTSSHYTNTELKPSFGGKKPNIFDIEVKNGMVYLADRNSAHLWRFSIREGPGSLVAYGPKKFFFPATLHFYDKQYYDLYLLETCKESKTPSTTLVEPTTAQIDLLDCTGVFAAALLRAAK